MSRRSNPFSLAALVVAFCCLALVPAGVASADDDLEKAGGLTMPDMPEITDVICISGCSKIREASVGGTIQITGKAMDSVGYVAFRGESKNLRVKPDQVTPTRVEATVPEGAISGRLRVLSNAGSASQASSQVLAINQQTFSRSGRLVVTDATTTPTTAFQYGQRRPTISFIVNGSNPKLDLRVDVVNARGDVVRSRFLNGVDAGSSQKVAWAGLVTGGKAAPNGTYRFVIRGNDGTAATISNQLKRKIRKANSSANGFTFRMYRYIFPLRGPKSYGDGIGAGRGHQGADVLAKCGQPLVAARAGTVYYNSYQASGAGNYLVINVIGGGSHVYMHMPTRSPLKVGTKVRTGQRIGSVGTTGRSTACHLHFEIWSAPGWYQGGTFRDPMPLLKAWDRYS